jgi:hypothetical protein
MAQIEVNDLQFQIAKLELNPDDILVVKYNYLCTQRQLDFMVRNLHNVTKGLDIHHILIMSTYFDLAVITQAEANSIVAQRKPPERIIPADLP